MKTSGGATVSDHASLLDLRIESIAAGGDGVSRDEQGRVVFVPRTAPGDRIRARVVAERASWARALPVEIVDPGPDRVQPPCRHATSCGGCQLQHISPVGQQAARRRIVADTLARIGGLDAAVPAPLEVEPAFGYRNRVTFALQRTADGVRAGYHRFDAPGDLVDVEDCPLAESAVREVWGSLRANWGVAAEALPEGRELRLTLRSSGDGRVAVLVEGGETGRPRAGDPARLDAGINDLACYHWRDGSGRRHHLAGSTTLSDQWGGLDLRLRPDAFVQVNRAAAHHLDEWVDRHAGPPAGRRLLDLYAGVGTRALRWALAGGEAVACEVDADAVKTGQEAASRYAVDVRFLRSRVGATLDSLLPADAVVVNPPRQGLSRRVSARLAHGDAGALIYVSCDPATLARDLRRLKDAWQVRRVQPIDVFPQTAHVETLVWLEPLGRSA
jgi:23S rRNA (uracil1939-C5)-methyltransferase